MYHAGDKHSLSVELAFFYTVQTLYRLSLLLHWLRSLHLSRLNNWGCCVSETSLPQDLIAQTQHQLARLDKLPPDWDIAYSRKLIEQVQLLWPDQAKSPVQQWQQQINISVLPVDKTNGWHEGMTQLQALADKLNALDGQKGKIHHCQ